jgi:hypothetical protein
MDLGVRRGIGKIPEMLVGSEGRGSSTSNRVAAVSKKPDLVAEGQGFSGSLFQGKKSSLVSRKSVKNLSRLQRQVLNEIAHHGSRGSFLSMRDLERMLPNTRPKIDHALMCLKNLGLVNCARVEEMIYFCPSEKFDILRKQVRALAACGKTEKEIINIVRESLKKLYPDALASDSEGFPGSDESSCFDIVFRFDSCVMGKQFFVVDVFAKISVTKQIVQSFSRRIRLTCIRSKEGFRGDLVRSYPLRGKTLGMLICNMATKGAIETAKDHDISLLHFRDIRSCYDQVHELVSLIQTMD